MRKKKFIRDFVHSRDVGCRSKIRSQEKPTDMSVEDSVSSLLSFSSSDSSSVSEQDESFGTDTSSLSSAKNLDSSATNNDDTEDPRASTRTDCPDLDPSLRKPLHEGSNLSIWESCLLIMKYLLRHSLSRQAVSDLLTLVGLHLPDASMASHYKLKIFLDLYEDISITTHYCCSTCHSPFDDHHSACRNGCTSGASEFLTISVEAQLNRKLQSKSKTLELPLNFLLHSTLLYAINLRSNFLGPPTTEV